MRARLVLMLTRMKQHVLMFTLLTASACTMETLDSDTQLSDAQRHDAQQSDVRELGSAQQALVGSCESACGGRSADGCYCDAACARYGDCCDDKAQVCDGEVTPPAPPPPPVTSPGDVPDSEHCAPAASWAAPHATFEQSVLTLVNSARASGGTCGSKGSFAPSAPLTMQPALRCAARLHSMDMALNGYFSHTSQDGTSPFVRMQQAGYSYGWAGENIAAGTTTPAAVMQGWLASPGHCANILNPKFSQIGVGYASGGPYGHYWTQSLASPK